MKMCEEIIPDFARLKNVLTATTNNFFFVSTLLWGREI
jgi:hypothetical protein